VVIYNWKTRNKSVKLLFPDLDILFGYAVFVQASYDSNNTL